MRTRLVAALSALAVVVPLAGARALPLLDSGLVEDPAGFVTPLMGSTGDGFTVPGAVTPFGLTQVSPDTPGPVAYAGYSWHDPAIRGFSLVHTDGAGVFMGGDLPFMPMLTAPLDAEPMSYSAPYNHVTEHATAGAYDVTLDNGIRVDLAATPHGGLQRWSFPGDQAGKVLAAVGRNNEGAHPAEVRPVGTTGLEGSTTEPGFGGGYTIHFSARFSRAFDSATSPFTGETAALLSFPAGPPVTMAVGISFVDLDGARANLAAEIPGFDVAKAQADARAAWTRELSRVRVSATALPDELATFYTSLYRAFHHPDVDSDVDGRYRGPDKQVHQVVAGHQHYENYSLWDTIRGESALLATLVPDRFADMMDSLSAFGEQSGQLPKWSLHYGHPDYMIGDPAIPTLVDGLCRGVRGTVETEALYQQMRSLAFDKRKAGYLERGYVNTGESSVSVSETLELALADAALAVLADALGHHDDAAVLTERAGAWKRLLHNGFLQPRDPSGAFPASYDPTMGTHYKEGTGWQYLWLVPHDEAALSQALGSADYSSKLDHFFTSAVTAGAPGVPAVPLVQSTETVFGINYYGDQYVPGNEHDLQAPYLYDWTDTPSTTQGVIASERSLFNSTPLGMPGNDDLGSLSAWYVWSALGFYPSIPGAPVAVIGTPLFERAELTLGSGAPFVVEAPGAAALAPYIGSATLDGVAHDRTWLANGEIHPGGHLSFAMSGAQPSTWGSGTANRPPSLSSGGPAAFGCRLPA